MARLPPDGDWLIQQNDGIVSLFHRYTEEEIFRFDPSDEDETAQVQLAIHECVRLTDEQKCFAHFWCGYFYAHARMNTERQWSEVKRNVASILNSTYDSMAVRDAIEEEAKRTDI